MQFDVSKFSCPCGSDKLYAECCSNYHNGTTKPETALQLMRSRYCAYALGKIEYIIQTTHPQHADALLPIEKRRYSIKNFCQSTQFKKLEILAVEEKGTFAFVTFKAYLMQNAQDVSFIEKSTFEKINNEWLYLKGEFLHA